MKFVICLALIALTQAVMIKHASNPHAAVFAQLENLEDHPLGKKILDTIAIQMRNQSPLSDIAKMLQDLRENLVLQYTKDLTQFIKYIGLQNNIGKMTQRFSNELQQDAELVHVAQEADCEAEIYGYNRRIEFASNEITEATMDINKYTADIELLQQEIDNQVIQLNILNQQEEQLREQRAEDHAAYQEREIQTPKVVEALDVIAAKLSAIQPEADAEVVQLNVNIITILAELERVGGENPILALVQLASTFSAEKLQSVQAKIGELRASLEQALIDDREEEIQQQLNFEAQIYSIEEQREAIQSAKAEAETKIVQVEHMLAAAKKRKYDAGRELESASNGKKMKEAQCDNWRSLYARDTEQRITEISIIRQVEQILATKLEGASSYIKGRIN